MFITDIRKLRKGQKVTCAINGVPIHDCTVEVDSKGFVYVCQDKKDGSRCRDKHGHRYSWVVHNPTEPGSRGDPTRSLRAYGVTDVKPVPGNLGFDY